MEKARLGHEPRVGIAAEIGVPENESCSQNSSWSDGSGAGGEYGRHLRYTRRDGASPVFAQAEVGLERNTCSPRHCRPEALANCGNPCRACSFNGREAVCPGG